jgi:hypothetical protein
MEQIGGVERNLGWKETCYDVSTLCDADVFFAVDYCSPEAGLRRHFHGESPVWLDGGRMGYCTGLGLRGRRPAARFCDGWSGALLHPLRSDDGGAAFLSGLRAAVVSRQTRSGEKTVAGANGIPHPLLRNAKDGTPVKARIVTRGVRVSNDKKKKRRQDALRVRSGQAGATPATGEGR